MRQLKLMAPSVVMGLLMVAEPVASQPLLLRDGTPVRLRLNRNLSSADAKVGETVDLEVLEDLKVGEVLVIPRGGTAIATVTQAVPKRRMARGGKLAGCGKTAIFGKICNPHYAEFD